MRTANAVNTANVSGADLIATNLLPGIMSPIMRFRSKPETHLG